mgnify:CR=1 FL=1
MDELWELFKRDPTTNVIKKLGLSGKRKQDNTHRTGERGESSDFREEKRTKGMTGIGTNEQCTK